MTTTTHDRTQTRPPSGARRFGYTVAIAVNVAMLVVVNNILGWELLPFLTDDFSRLLWLIDISLLAAIFVNLAYLAYDATWFKAICQIGVGVISLAVALRTLQVFPFDFSGGQTDWTWLVRLVLIIAIVGSVGGIIAEVVKLAKATPEAL